MQSRSRACKAGDTLHTGQHVAYNNQLHILYSIIIFTSDVELLLRVLTLDIHVHQIFMSLQTPHNTTINDNSLVIMYYYISQHYLNISFDTIR